MVHAHLRPSPAYLHSSRFFFKRAREVNDRFRGEGAIITAIIVMMMMMMINSSPLHQFVLFLFFAPSPRKLSSLGKERLLRRLIISR